MNAKSVFFFLLSNTTFEVISFSKTSGSRIQHVLAESPLYYSAAKNLGKKKSLMQVVIAGSVLMQATVFS